MSALEAARLGDQIGHTSAWAGLIAGALVGIALAVAVIAIVGTGGVAAVAIGAGIAAAGAGGALAGAHIGELVPSSPKGPIATGSPDTLVGQAKKNAARAGIDVVACKSHGTKLIATGSSTVFVNRHMFARKTDTTVCSAKIRDGCGTVLVGGETAIVPGLEIEDEIPPWLKKTLFAVMIAGTIIATGGAALVVGIIPATVGLVGGIAGGYLGGELGGAVARAMGCGELGVAIGEVIGGTAGGFLGGFAGSRVGSTLNRSVAGAPGETYLQQNARQVVAREFYTTQGQKWDPTLNGGAGGRRTLYPWEINSEMNAINFRRPVEVVESPSGLAQIQSPGNPQGNYYATRGTTPNELGIGDVGAVRDPTGAFVPTNKEVIDYNIAPGTPALRSTSAPADDFWSLRGTTQPTDGGGTQYYIPDVNGPVAIPGSNTALTPGMANPRSPAAVPFGPPTGTPSAPAGAGAPVIQAPPMAPRGTTGPAVSTPPNASAAGPPAAAAIGSAAGAGESTLVGDPHP